MSDYQNDDRYNRNFSNEDEAMMLGYLTLPRDRQPHTCGWVDGGVACCHPLLPEQFSGHLRTLHGVTGDDKTKMYCRWVGCNTPMTKGSVVRHVFEAHLGIKYSCPVCGTEFSRKDTMNKHMKTVH